MGLFNFFKKDKQDDAQPQERHWLLRTNDGEVIEPTWDEIESAVTNAKSEQSVFATLAYVNAGLEIDSVQTLGDDSGYRFEALSQDGDIYVNDGLSHEETLKYFEEFFNTEKVVGYRSWMKE